MLLIQQRIVKQLYVDVKSGKIMNIEFTQEELMSLKIVLEKARHQFASNAYVAITDKYIKENNGYAEICNNALDKIKKVLKADK